MFITLKICNRNSFHKTFNKNRISCFFLKSLWKTYIFITFKMSIESSKILFFNIEIYLISKSFFKRVLSNWNFKSFWKECALYHPLSAALVWFYVGWLTYNFFFQKPRWASSVVVKRKKCSTNSTKLADSIWNVWRLHFAFEFFCPWAQSLCLPELC